MTEHDAYTMLKGAARPWTKEEPESSQRTLQSDPPEFVAACLSCPLERCMGDSVRCPLHQVERIGLTKSGTPDRRTAKYRGYEDMMDKLCSMIRYGGTTSWICKELGITKATFYRRRAELVKAGRLA